MSAARAVCIAGPTCTGKTRLAVTLALRLHRAELINADSRQVRSGLQVGTCAPTAAELRGIRCHLLGVVQPSAPHTVADWLGAARSLLAELLAGGAIPIVVGGTGLYVRALLDGYTLAAPPRAETRAARDLAAATAHGRERLADELRARAPDRAMTVDLANPRRVIRALEALDAGAAPGVVDHNPAAGALRIALDVEPALHDCWIRRRTEAMFASGALLAETERALAAGVPPAQLERCGIGYREALAVIADRLTPAEAQEAVVRRTSRYARAQRTFFRADRRMTWLDSAGDTGELAEEVAATLPSAV